MKARLKDLARRAGRLLTDPLANALVRLEPTPPDATAQLLLQMQYRSLLEGGHRLPGVSETGFKAFSQTDEDGILLYLFSLIGTHGRSCVEISAGDGTECNTTNLILNHGWTGLLVDGDERKVEFGRAFFQQSRYTYVFPPRFVHAWVTRENVNRLLSENGFTGEIDLLSIDVDGVDYWLWEAIEVARPRVVVVEFQDILGPDRAWTVPYSDTFDCADYPVINGVPCFAGASLPAFVKLGRKKGYRLVGTNRYAFNAFFVRNDLAPKEIPEVEAAACLTHPKVTQGARERLPVAEGLPWVEV